MMPKKLLTKLSGLPFLVLASFGIESGIFWVSVSSIVSMSSNPAITINLFLLLIVIDWILLSFDLTACNLVISTYFTSSTIDLFIRLIEFSNSSIVVFLNSLVRNKLVKNTITKEIITVPTIEKTIMLTGIAARIKLKVISGVITLPIIRSIR